MRTARSRTSGENWFDFLLMAQYSQRKEPPQKPGRLSPDYERLEELDHLAILAKGSLLAARRWLDAPNQALEGMTPEEVARTPEGFARVRQLLTSSTKAR